MNREIASIALEEESDASLMVEETTGPKEGWILDSRSFQHMCCRKEWFILYEQLDGLYITLPNGKEAKVEGLGEVEIMTRDGRAKKLCEISMF